MNKVASTFAFSIIILQSANAHAYVDPGSGSVIVTAILGFFAAIGYTTRKYYYRIKRLMKRDKNEKKSTLDNN